MSNTPTDKTIEAEALTCIDPEPHDTKPCQCAGRWECHECGREVRDWELAALEPQEGESHE